jgi:hypothetical protein
MPEIPDDQATRQLLPPATLRRRLAALKWLAPGLLVLIVIGYELLIARTISESLGYLGLWHGRPGAHLLAAPLPQPLAG